MSAMWSTGGGMKRKSEEQPHAKRRGRLKNGNPVGDFTKAPRCGAMTRKGTPCKAPAMANGRCRMHGGCSPGAPVGNKNALKHGLYTKEAREQNRHFRELLKRCGETIEIL